MVNGTILLHRGIDRVKYLHTLTSDGDTEGDTGGDIGSVTSDGDTEGDTGGDIGSVTSDGDTEGDTGGDIGSVTSDGDTEGDTGGDIGSVTSDGDTEGDTGSGDDSGSSNPTYLATIIPVTNFHSSVSDLDISERTEEGDSPMTRTLGIVSISLHPDPILIVNGGSDGYRWVSGDYSGGVLEITGEGTAETPNLYQLTADLISGATAGTQDIHNFAIKISASNVILDGNSYGVVGSRVSLVDGIVTSRSYVTIQNFGDITKFGSGLYGYGIYSTGDSTIITGNTITYNQDGIRSEGNSAIITGNTIDWNSYGIRS